MPAGAGHLDGGSSSQCKFVEGTVWHKLHILPRRVLPPSSISKMSPGEPACSAWDADKIGMTEQTPPWAKVRDSGDTQISVSRPFRGIYFAGDPEAPFVVCGSLYLGWGF